MRGNKYVMRLNGADTMPIPPPDAHLERFDVGGGITIGVEYRVLTEDVVLASGVAPGPIPIEGLDDRGVSLHVYVKLADGDLERLRFDCFDEGPHYHYVSWPELYHDTVFLDPIVHGDSLPWALECIRTRLAKMLRHAGIGNAAQFIDQERLEQVLPAVAAFAYQARNNTDPELIRRDAISLGNRYRSS